MLMCYDFQFNLSTKNYNIRQASAFFRQRLSNRQHFRQESKRKFFFKTSKNAGIKNIRHNTLFLARIRTATILYSYTSTYWRDSDFIILHFAKMNNKKNTIHYLSSAWPWTLTKNIRNNIAISMPPYIVLVRDWFLLYFCLGSCYMFSAATIYILVVCWYPLFSFRRSRKAMATSMKKLFKAKNI